MKVTYLGTASVLLEYGGSRLITDPVFDPAGSTYSMGPSWVPARWFNSTKGYVSPVTPDQLGSIDVALISHDHHRDNLDVAGRALLNSSAVSAVVTNPAAARRLSRDRGGVTGLRTGESFTMASGVRVTATPARHGPRFTPQVGEVTGFLLEAPTEPTVWISGDTVLSPDLRVWAASTRGIDVAIIHAGGVRFPAAPLLGSAVFTFPPAQFVDVCGLLDPRVIIPVHRSGWSHFQPENELRDALADAGLVDRTRWLELGDTADIAR